MIAFDKIDGSNIRVKYTNKRGFDLFGSRNQLLDSSHPHLGGVVAVFNTKYKDILEEYFRKFYPKEKEIIVFGEYYGPNSFAGVHVDPLDQMDFHLFDVLFVRTYTEFLLPQEFIKLVGKLGSGIHTPKIVYEGNLTDQFIKDVRDNKFSLNEGVICKGTSRLGSFRGKVWMAKIKTTAYLQRLRAKYGEKAEEYWE